MIKELKGDLLAADCDVVMHCCNCFHTMGSGIARVIKKMYPAASDADYKTKYASKEKLGTFSMAKVDEGNKYIFNVYGQYRYGGGVRNVDYDALEAGLTKVYEYLKENDLLDTVKIGTYRIGCNRGGASWSEVKPILERSFPDCDVYVYEL